MPPCNFIQKTNLRPCSVYVREGHCARHSTLALTLPPLVPNTCEFHHHNWCGQPIQPGKRFCPHHYRVALRSSINLIELLESVPPGEEALFEHVRQWRQRVDRRTLTYVDLKALFVSLVEREHPHMYEAVHMPPNMLRFWAQEIRPPGMRPEWWEDPRVQDVWNQHHAQVAQPGPPPPAETNRLRRLARDGQNVHTPEVVRQSREGEELLLAVPTNGKHTCIEITHAFSARFKGDFSHFVGILTDINTWYARTEVRVRGDRLYARLLDGLWTMIKQQPTDIRTELVTRLWQEIGESNGMCAEGHISRLVNVMVGFNDHFKPSMSTGELLQSRLAAISVSNISLELKLKEARLVLEDLHIPTDEHAVWLEAF